MRPLSNPEWVAFQQAIDVDKLNLPQWGGVVEWEGMDVFVLVGPTPECTWSQWFVGSCPRGELFLSDISDMQFSADPRVAGWKDNLEAAQDPGSQLWYYRFPEAFAEIFYERAIQVADYTEDMTEAVTDAIQKAVKGAGDIFETVGQPWFLLALAGIAAVLLFQMAPKRT